jgi:hypothetical protein
MLLLLPTSQQLHAGRHQESTQLHAGRIKITVVTQ